MKKAQTASQAKQPNQSPQKRRTQKMETKRHGKLSLHPMEFEDALAVLLNTPPPPKPAKSTTKKRAAKKAAKK